MEQSDRSFLVTVLLWFFLGVFGIHRFYAGKIGTAILMFLTGGGFLIWWLIDGVILLTGGFTDAGGRTIKN